MAHTTDFVGCIDDFVVSLGAQMNLFVLASTCMQNLTKFNPYAFLTNLVIFLIDAN